MFSRAWASFVHLEVPLIVNQYRGTCAACGIPLNPGEGFAFRRSDSAKYVTVCNGRVCVEKEAPPSEIKSYERHMERMKVRRLRADGTIEMPYELESLALVRAMPGADFDYDGDKKWHVSTANKDRRRLLELARKIKLDVDEELLTIDVPDKVKELKEYIADTGLKPYQQEGALWIREQDSCLLADEMGLGKTPQVLVAMDEDYGHIIVCPNNVLYNWVVEGLTWRSDLSWSIIERTKDFRIPNPGECVVVSYTMLPKWVAPQRGKRKNRAITAEQREALSKCVAIYDECHYLANSKTKRHHLCKHLTRECHHAIGMTGTPVRNRELELWNVFNVLGLADSVFGSFISFIKMMDGRKGNFGYEFGGNIRKDVPDRLRRVMLRRLKKDVQKDLPPKVYQPIFIDTDQKVRDKLDSAWDLYRESSEFRKGKLPEFTEMSSVKRELAIAAIPTTISRVEDYEAAGVPVIVVSCHVAPIERLNEREGWAVIRGGMSAKEKQAVVEAWQAGKLKGLGVSLGAATAGITLTYGSHIIRNDIDWVPANNAQFEDRIHRIGQDSTCVYEDIVSDHPLLRHIHKLNYHKLKLAAKSMEKIVGEVKDPTTPDEALTETQEDYEKRVAKAAKQVHDKERAAILTHLSSWKRRYPHDDKDISSERAEVIREAANTMLAIGKQPLVRRRGQVIKGGVFQSGHKRVVRLLHLAGLETNEELLLAESILLQYEGELRSLHPELFNDGPAKSA